MRATFSPAIARICSPVVSSVVSISANAVESHAASGRPDKFRKPSTAIDRRGEEPAVVAIDDAGVTSPRKRVIISATATPRTTIDTAPTHAARVPRGLYRRVETGSVVLGTARSAFATSAADCQRSAGRLAKLFARIFVTASGASGRTS